MTPPRRIRALLVAVLVVAPALGGTIEVEVRERGGPPVADLRVRALRADGSDPAWRYRAVGTTDGAGRVALGGLEPGPYRLVVDLPQGTPFVAPGDNRFAPAPVVTLAKPDERVAITIELWRGVGLVVQASVDRGDLPRVTALVRDLATGATTTRPAGVNGIVETLLVPGRYEVALEIPPGYRIAALERNGEPVEGHAVRVDATQDARTQQLRWELSVPCLVTGRVAPDSATIVATRIEAGPWLADAAARGGTVLDRVPAQRWPEPEVYELRLPDGHWRIAPESPRLLRAEPEYVDLRLAPGESRSQSFVVELDDEERRAAILVRVEPPVEGAVLELYRAEETGPGGDPVETARYAGRGFPPRLRPADPGAYRVVAGHVDWLPGHADVVDFDPDEKEDRRVTVTLQRGGVVRARATEDDGSAAHDVELAFERLEGPPDRPPADEELREAKRRGTRTSDATGWITHAGLHRGRYRFEARVTGERGATRFALVGIPGSGVDLDHAIELELGDGEEVELDLRVRPAAHVTGRLSCDDGVPPPPRAEVRVVPAALEPVDLESDAILRLDAVALAGRDLDAFTVGPLESGAYRIAIRPAGIESWTLAYDALEPESGATFALDALEPTEAGEIRAFCGPILRNVPVVRSGEALPDLRLAEVTATGAVRSDTGATSPLELRAIPARGRIHVLGVGSSRVDLQACKLEYSIVSPK